MKATLEFNLPEEKNEHRLAINGSEYYSCLFDLDQKLRSWLRYGHEYKNVDAVLEELRQYINDNVNLYEVE